MVADVGETANSSGDLLEQFRAMVAAAGGPGPAARALDVAKTTLDQWFNGKSRIPLEPAVKLAKLTGSSLDALLLGAGQPTVPSHVTTNYDAFVSVPMLKMRASAGVGQIAIQGEPQREDIVSFREDWLRSIGLLPGRAEAMTAIGDSMEPTIRDGDLLLVDRSIDRVVNHGIYVLVYNGAVLVKRVQLRLDGSLVLKSDNTIYGEEVVAKNEATELIIEGRVRWFGRKI